MITDWDKHAHIKMSACANGDMLSAGHIDLDTFVKRLIDDLQSMIFRKFEMPLADAMRDYCHFALVEPILVEAYLGQRFDNIDFETITKWVESRKKYTC